MGAESAKVWSVQGFTINFNLFANLNGGAGEDGIAEIEPASPDFTTTIGADGSVVFNQTGNQLFNVTIKVLPTSAVNTSLAVIRALGTNGIGPFLLKNNNGLLTLIATSAVITDAPKVSISKEAGANEWKIAVVGTFFPAGA